MKPLTAFPPRAFLPLMLFVAVLIIGVRLSDMWDLVSSGKAFSAVKTSHAEASEAQKMPEIHTPTMAAPVPEKDKAAEGAQTVAPKEGPSASPGPAIKREGDDSEESELVKQLTSRRNQLDQRAKTLDSREAVIKVAEQRVDQKMKEMETLRVQLQSMIDQLSASQQTQIENLVKIYETMKPKEAAKIFEALDMKVLLGVVQRMKPARTAAVMAEMAPEKAKEITVALTKQDQLPQLK